MKNKIIAVLTAISIALSMFCYLPASAYADGENRYGTDMYFRLLTGMQRSLIWDNTFIPESSKSPCLNDFMNDLHDHLQSGGIGGIRKLFEIEISGDVYVNKSIDLSEFVDNYQLETLIIASRVGPHKKDAVIHNNVPDKAPMFIVNKQALQVVFVNIQISGDNIPETANILSDSSSIIQYVDKSDAESISEEDGSASDDGIFDTESENNSSDETVSDEDASVAESESDSSVEEVSDEDIDAAEKEDSSENMVLGEDEENEDLNADAIEPTEDGSSSSGVMSDGDYFESSTLFTASTDNTNEDVKGNPLITVSNNASVRFTNKSLQYSENNGEADELFPVKGIVQLQNQYGSGVYVGENGTLYMDKQTEISKCDDYGVYVDHNGTFEMRGDTEFHSIPSGSYDDYFGLDLNSNDSTNPPGAQISECKHGGVFVADGGTFTMESNSTIENCGKYDGNDGKLKFGGVYIKDGGKFNMQGNMRTEFLTDDQTNSTENIFINSDRYQKGSPAASGLSANITDNSAIEGGGIYIESGSVTGGSGADDNIKITGGKITNNKAENAITDPTRITKGGGIYVEGGTISIGDADSTKANVEITDNIAQQGGGIYTKGNVELKAGVSVSQNGTKENEIVNEGGGVYIGNGGTLKVSNGGSVSTNTANDGGGVYIGEGGTFNVSDGGSISTNQAKNGGGVYVGSGGEFNLPNPDSTGTQSGSVSNNNATENGGGIYVGEGGTFTLSEGGSITENKATGNGGGVYVGTDSTGSTGGTGGTGSTGGTFNLNGGVIGVKPAEGEAPESGGANTAAHGGGVYYNDGTFNLSGSPVVSGNSPTNVVLFRDAAHQYPKINITGEVETNDFSNVYIGYSDSEKGIFTNDWKTYNKAENNTDAAIPSPFFWSDDPRYMVALNSGANEDGKDIPAQTEAELVDGFHIHSPCGHYCTKVLDPNLTDADGKKITLIGSDGKVNWEAFDKISGYDFLCAQGHETDAVHKTHKTYDGGQHDTDVFNYESVSDAADFAKKFNEALNNTQKNEITLYLLNDITLTGTFETNKDLYICLNGHTLTINGGITLTDSANFALDDCYYDDCYTQHETKKNEGKGKVITSSGTFVTNNGSGTVTLYSGTIEGGTAVSLNSNDGNLFVEDAILVDSNIKATDTTTATITIHRRSAYKGTTDESGVTLNDKTMSGGEINAPGCTVNIIGKSDLNTAVSAASVNGSDINITYGDVTVDGSMKAGNNLNINGSKVTGEASIEANNDLTVKDSDVNVNTKLGGNKTTTITDSNINNEFGSGSSAIGGQTVNIGNSTVTVFTVSGTNTVIITTNSNVTGDVSSPQVTVDGSSTITGDVTVNGDSDADSIDGQFISGTINGHLMLQGDSGTEIGTFTVTAGEGEVDAALNKGETDKKAKLYLYGSPAIGSIECKSYEAHTDTQLFGKTDGKAQLAVTTPITLIVDPRKEGNFVMQEVEKNQENSFILQKASEITPTGEYTQYDAYYMGLEHIAESSSLQIAFALFIGTDDQMNPEPEKIIEFTPFIDSNFRAYLRSRFLGETDKKYLYKKDIVTICGSEEGINLSTTKNGDSWGVTDLSGIRFFGTDPDHSYSGTLKTLVISNNTIIQPDELWSEELKRLQGTLTTFKCSNCGFNELNVSDFTKLEVLDCSKNGISTLSLDKNTALTELNCSENELNALDVSNANNLSILNCSDNNITSIESIKNKTALTELYCAENYLHDELDLTSNTGLVKINCSSQKGDQKNNGRITVLKLDGLNNLKEVCCNENNITYLKFENPNILEKVEASGNTYSIGTSCSEYNPQTSPNEGFDPAKVENPVGAEFAEAAFNNYDYQNHNGSITYNYNIGTTVGGRIANQLIEFKLTYSHTEGDHTDPSPATCTEDEKISGYKCSVCKENFLEHNVDSVVLDGWQDPDNLHSALGHKWVYIEGENPTCEEGHNGHRGYYICQHDISDYDGVHAIPCSEAWGTKNTNADGTVTYTPTEVWFVGVDTANQKVELNLESDALKYLPKDGTISGDKLVDHKLYVEPTHKDDAVPYNNSTALFLNWEHVAHKFDGENSYHDENPPTCITPGNIAYYECDVCHKPFNKDVDRSESSGIIDKNLRDAQKPKEISETFENHNYTSEKDRNTYDQLGYHLKAYGHNFENAPKYGLKQNGEHHNLDQADCVTTGTWEYWYCGNCGKYFIRRDNTPHYKDDRKDGEDGIGSKSDYPGKFIDSSDPNDFTKTEIATVKAPDLVSPFAGDDDHKFAVHTNEELTVNAPADLTEPINKFRHKEFNGEAQPHHVDALNDTVCDEHGIKEYLACARCHSIVTMMNEAEHRANPIIEKNVYDLFINPNDTYTGHTSAPVNLSNDTDGGVLKKINANKPPISSDAYLGSLVEGSDERKVIEALKANNLWREAGQHTPPDYGEWIAEPDDPLHDYYICTKCGKNIHYNPGGVNEADFRHDRGSNAYDYTYTDGTEDPENYHHYYCQKCKDSSDAATYHIVKYEEKMTPETVSALHLECVNFNDKRELIPGDDENHYKRCSDCNRPIKEEHHWTGNFQDDPDNNVHFKICSDCGYRLEESHTYNPDEFRWDNDNHYHLCTICGHRDKISDHVYDYRYVDNNSHERYCTVDGCEYKEPPTSHDEKPENGSDLWTNADEADPSDAEHKNMHYYFCNTCNHNVYEEHRGRLLDMQSDPEGHWIQCEVCNGNPVRQPHHGTEVVQRNDDDRLIYHDIVCDYKDEETGKECGYHGPAYHNWKEVAQKDPTCTEDGTEHYYFCEDCGIMVRSVDTVTTADNKTYLKGVNEIGSLDAIRIEALHHLWYGSSEWKYSEDYTIHYQECERCHKIIDPADPYFDPAHYHKCDLELVGNTSPDGSHRHYFKCRKCDFALDASPETSVNWSPGEETVDGELRTYHYHKCIGTTVPENYKALEGQIKNIACECEADKELHVPSGLSENLISLDDECHRDVCAICGLQFRIKHTYVSTDPDGVHEWGYKNPNVHTKRCTVCGHVKEEAHDIFANAEITDEEHIGECEGCGKQISGRHGEWIYEPINETSHKLTCGICHKYSTIEEHSKDGVHNIIWVPCEDDPTMHHKVCALCGFDFLEKRPHSSFEWKYDDIRDPDTHYLVCKDCGAEIDYPITNYDGKGHDFNPDEIHLHSFLSYDSDGKLINDKTQAMCSDCHKRNEEYKSPNHGGGDDPRPPQPPFNWDDSSDSSEDSSSSDNSGGSDNSDNSGNSGNSDNSGNSGNSGDSGSSDNSGNSNNSGDPNSSGNDTSNPDDNTKDGIGVDTSDFDDLIITDSEIDRTNTNGAHGNIYKVVRCGRDAPWTYLDTSLEELIDMLATDRDLAAVKDEATDMEFLLTVRNADRTVSIDDRRITEKLAAQTDERIGQYLDIDLYKLLGRDRWQLHETERNLRIRFEVPERLQRLSPNREYTVLRIHEGIPTFLDDLDRNPNTITIDTDRFSTYVILYNSHGDSSGLINNENPYTGVRNITIVPTVLAALTVFKTCKRVDE